MSGYHGPMRRTFRIVLALLAAAALVFGQAVTAAYACAGPVADPVAMAQMKAQMGPDAGLCEKHCASGAVSLEAAKPAGASLPVVAPVALRLVELPRIAPVALAVRARVRSLAGPAPPLIRFTVLRI
jgi:hypothetical protein